VADGPVAAFLALGVIVTWALHVRHITQHGVTVRLSHWLAFGTAVLVAVAGTVAHWGVVKGFELRADQSARDRRRRADAHAAEGKRLARDGAHADAIHGFGSAIGLDPSEGTLTEAYRERGRAHATRRENIAAVKDVSTVLLLYPEDRDSLFERAQFLLEIDQCCQEVVGLRSVVRGTALMKAIDPEYAPVYHNLAIAEAALDRFNPAFEAIEEAVRLNDEHPSFLRIMGQVHAARGERAQAMTP
jgi:tetratricopeptide (TPR) repeat protein